MQDEEDFELYDEGEAEEDDDEEPYDCGMDSDGGCAYIGSEDCDQCPERDELDEDDE